MFSTSGGQLEDMGWLRPLRKKFKRQTVFRQKVNSIHRQRLINAQEDALIDQINKLTDKKIHPTVKMMRNFAEEIISGSIKKKLNGVICTKT